MITYVCQSTASTNAYYYQPIFLRVCHSPWISIGQKALVGLRGVTAAYMLTSFIMILDYELRINKHGWLTAFEFSNVAYFLQTLYHGIAFVSLHFSLHQHIPHKLLCRSGPSCTSITLIMVARHHLPPPAFNDSYHHPAKKRRPTTSSGSVFFTLLPTSSHMSLHWSIGLLSSHMIIATVRFQVCRLMLLVFSC